MNCKTLYRGDTSFRSLDKLPKKVLYAIAGAIFDNIDFLSIRDRVILLRPDSYWLSFVCENLHIDDVEVVEQYPTSLFYHPYKCNFRVRLSSNRVYSTFVSL